MAYQIVSFDDIALPLYNPRQDHSGASVESSLLSSVGGVFDYYGARWRRGRMQQIQVTGEFWGELEYRIDSDGNYRVDSDGNYLITGSPETVLRDKVEGLRAKRGAQGQLWRIRLDDNVRQWITARLLQVECPQVVEDRTTVVRATCTFESAMDAWRAETQTVSSKALISGMAGVVVQCSSSADVEDAEIHVTASGGSITSFVIEGSGIDLRFTGTIANGQTLVIDCGSQTVRVNGVDHYSNFSLGPNHTAQDWCPLVPGNNVFVVTSNQAGTISFKHYNEVF